MAWLVFVAFSFGSPSVWLFCVAFCHNSYVCIVCVLFCFRIFFVAEGGHAQSCCDLTVIVLRCACLASVNRLFSVCCWSCFTLTLCAVARFSVQLHNTTIFSHQIVHRDTAQFEYAKNWLYAHGCVLCYLFAFHLFFVFFIICCFCLRFCFVGFVGIIWFCCAAVCFTVVCVLFVVRTLPVLSCRAFSEIVVSRYLLRSGHRSTSCWFVAQRSRDKTRIENKGNIQKRCCGCVATSHEWFNVAMACEFQTRYTQREHTSLCLVLFHTIIAVCCLLSVFICCLLFAVVLCTMWKFNFAVALFAIANTHSHMHNKNPQDTMKKTWTTCKLLADEFWVSFPISTPFWFVLQLFVCLSVRVVVFVSSP